MVDPSIGQTLDDDPAEDAASADLISPDADRLAFLGPNADAYLPLWHASKRTTLQLGEAKATMHMRYCWPAFFVPLPWLFYRKLWIWGALSVIAPIVIELVVGPLSGTMSLAFAMLFFGKSLVIARGDTVIAAVGAMNLPPNAAHAKIGAAGGVSIVGAVLGSAIFVVLLFFTFVGAAHR